MLFVLIVLVLTLFIIILKMCAFSFKLFKLFFNLKKNKLENVSVL